MTKEEIIKQCKEVRSFLIKKGSLVNEAEYEEWVNKCLKHFCEKKDKSSENNLWNIVVKNNDIKFQFQYAVWGDLDDALLAYDVYYPQYDSVKLVKVAEVIIKEKEENGK